MANTINVVEPRSKRCNDCGKKRKIKHFRTHSRSKDGHVNTCNFCKNNGLGLRKIAEEEQAEALRKSNSDRLAKAKAVNDQKIRDKTKRLEQRILDEKEAAEEAERAAKAFRDAEAAIAEEAEAKELRDAEEAEAEWEAQEAAKKAEHEAEKAADEAEIAALEAEEVAAKNKKVVDEQDLIGLMPTVYGDEIKIVEDYEAKWKPRIKNLNKLSVIVENRITFIHVVLLGVENNNAPWATKECVLADMKKRFRSGKKSSLTGFTRTMQKIGLVKTKQKQVGWDSKKGRQIESTSHYALTFKGIDFFEKYIEENGLPYPVVPESCRSRQIGKAGEEIDQSAENTSFNSAIIDAESSDDMQSIMLNFLKGYKKHYNLKSSDMAIKLKVSTSSYDQWIFKGVISKKHHAVVKHLMLLNKNNYDVKVSTVEEKVYPEPVSIDDGNATAPYEEVLIVAPSPAPTAVIKTNPDEPARLVESNKVVMVSQVANPALMAMRAEIQIKINQNMLDKIKLDVELKTLTLQLNYLNNQG